MPPRESITRHEISWTHPLTGKPAKLRLTVTENYLVEGSTHLEIRSPTPRQPHPLSQTGYLSHFIDAEELAGQGGPVAFVRAWIARELRNPQFLAQDLKQRQGSLFDWAEAQPVASRTNANAARRPRPKTPRSAPSRRRPPVGPSRG